MDEQITIWSKSDSCQPCRLTKQRFLDSGIPFTERALEDASAAQLDEFRSHGFLAAPVVITEHHGTWAGLNPGKIRNLIADHRAPAPDAFPPVVALCAGANRDPAM